MNCASCKWGRPAVQTWIDFGGLWGKTKEHKHDIVLCKRFPRVERKEPNDLCGEHAERSPMQAEQIKKGT